MSTMTLAEVRDELRGLASDGMFGLMADAIDAHLTSREAKCSCPSGDGSLKWPCQAHSAAQQAAEPVEQAVGDGVIKMLQRGFITSQSYGPDKDYKLVIKFQSLTELQAAHRAVTAPRPDTVGVGDGVVVYTYQFDYETQSRYLVDGPVADGDKFVTLAAYQALASTTARPAVATPAEVTESRYIATGHGASDEVHRAANLLEKIPARHANDRAIMQAAVSYLRAHASSLASHPHTAAPSGGVKVQSIPISYLDEILCWEDVSDDDLSSFTDYQKGYYRATINVRNLIRNFLDANGKNFNG